MTCCWISSLPQVCQPSSLKGQLHGSLTLGVNVGKAGAVVIQQGVLQLRGSAEDVEPTDNSVSDLQGGHVVGWGVIDDAIEEGADDSRVVALSVADLRGSPAVVWGRQKADTTCQAHPKSAMQPPIFRLQFRT